MVPPDSFTGNTPVALHTAEEQFAGSTTKVVQSNNEILDAEGPVVVRVVDDKPRRQGVGREFAAHVAVTERTPRGDGSLFRTLR